MSELFKGWRRKFGVITLLIALGLTCEWIRSLYIEEAIDCTYESTRTAIASVDGRIFLVRQTFLDSSRTFGGFPVGGGFCIGGGSNSYPTRYENGIWKPIDFTASPDCTVDWRWDWLGFHASAGVVVPPGLRFVYRAIPYWSFVPLLTMLSAFLLLKKPTKSIQKKITESVSNEGK